MASIFQAAAVVVVALGTGAATVTTMKGDVKDYEVPDFAWSQGDALDGKVFYTNDTILETGEQLTDELRFENGRFQSAKCQKYCDFGWTEYQTWTEGEVIHFTTTTKCPDAPHTVVWYGTVTGDEVSFEVSWTTRRWYWTQQINGMGGGSTTPRAGAAVAG